ncbi:MAG: patatin, partial [Deltaproteobacteria bacterium]|nr:patatin [Deltaproteobacteria bacterium]
MKRKDLHAHLFGPGPKRILALDGGGIRGILTLQLLKRIENLVRERTGDNSTVLADYFDLIGGTSTGAIIAGALALGWRVGDIETLYRKLGNSIFQSSFFRKGLLWPKFSAEPVKKALE